MLGFSIAFIREHIKDLSSNNHNKTKVKGLGSFSEKDLARKLALRESIYGFAFFVNLKNSEIVSKYEENGETVSKYEIADELQLSSLKVFEVNMTAFLCAFC